MGGLTGSREPSPAVSALTGFDPGREAWRQVLIAFYERDALPQRAANLRRGAAFDYLDIRTIDALEAAIAQLREAA